MIQALLNEITAHGDRGAVVPISRIDDLRRDMETLKNGDYHTGYIDWMAGNAVNFMPTGLDFEPRSIIAVVSPSPKVLLRFIYHGKPIECVLPPSYADMDTKEPAILQYLNACLEAHGHKAAIYDHIPQKLLAVHCGLGRYGRNNICYNEEFGSYIRLTSYVSDMPGDETVWFPARRMDACAACRACAVACPTHAIDADRTVINAEICLTSLNERGGEFPEWLDATAHNCLVGCGKCQDCCPQNIKNKDFMEDGVTFTEEETQAVLNHGEEEQYPEELAHKIKAAGVASYAGVLPRNLAALLKPT